MGIGGRWQGSGFLLAFFFFVPQIELSRLAVRTMGMVERVYGGESGVLALK